MICKIGICGASGKMGQEIAALIQEGFAIGDCHFELSDAIVGSSRVKSIDGIEVRTLKDKAREPVHVWIDFSRPEATIQLLKSINSPVVIGTTGFSDDQWKEVVRYSAKLPVLFAPNMAPGMNSLVKMLEKSSFSPKLGFEVLASESHHKHKKDAPSGTMKRLLKALEQLGYQDTPVQVSRVGEVFGVHHVKFVSADEEITLEHRVLNRRVFAKGALLAAEFICQNQEPKIYSFSEVLKS
ncbi:hypothetical protein EBQ74_05520 [bacterium]|nr:hypothetical protein [bacterium]